MSAGNNQRDALHAYDTLGADRSSTVSGSIPSWHSLSARAFSRTVIAALSEAALVRARELPGVERHRRDVRL
jgi:hypothetical protein